jgi:hypothetical protein
MFSGIRGWENGCNITPYWLSPVYGTHSERQTEEGGNAGERAETTQEKENKPEPNDERTVFSGSLSRENL